MRNAAVDDSELVDHAAWELESNNTSHPDGQSNNGSDSTGPLDHLQAPGDSDLAATADFEDSLYGPTQGGPTTSGSDDPYLDTADVVDLEDGQPGYVPAPDDADRLGDILEGVQIGVDGVEDVDPSEVEQFPHAGEIKDPESRAQSRFETLYEEACGNPFHPFRGAAEFELVKWLNGLPLSKVDSFLQLDWVSHV